MDPGTDYLLISRGANIRFIGGPFGPTAVHAALHSGDIELLRAAIKRGAPVVVNEQGRRYDALAATIQEHRLAHVKMLLEAGVKPGACDGVTGPKGVVRSHLELAKQMVEFGDVGDAKEILKLIEEAGK